jgi:hypothetical protein
MICRREEELMISRYIGDIFRALPDRASFPDYYETIPEPESLDNISVRLLLVI